MLHQALTQPNILAVLGASGHGDTVAIVDSNYPAQSRREHHVPLINLNITHQVAPTPLLVQLIAQSIPIERCTLPVPADEIENSPARPVHEAIIQSVSSANPGVEISRIQPQDFYALTSSPALALMIVTGERSHYGSTVLTLGYLPELDSPERTAS